MNTPTPRRRILMPGIPLALLLLAAFAKFRRALKAMMDGVCGNTEITRLTAPDGRHDAILFERNCGATTDFATHVSVLPAGAPLGDDAGNTFVAAAGDASPRAPWGGPPVDVAWDADGVLAIRYVATVEVFHAAEAVDGVVIRVN